MAKQRKTPKAVKLRTGLLTKLLIVILLAALGCKVYTLREQVSAAEAEKDRIAALVEGKRQENDALAADIDYAAVQLEGDAVALPDGMELDLGAVAKGCAGDILAREVRDSDISSALLDLGQSTIVAVGAKPGGQPWRIGVVDPAQPGTYFAVVELEDMAMGTSGGYQRYFEQDGAIYWHILDPRTAAPARAGLASVTVVSPSALVCDGLSTALFVMGLDEGAQFWRDHPELEFEAIFVAENGEIYCTAGLEGRFSLAEGYEAREVVVLE